MTKRAAFASSFALLLALAACGSGSGGDGGGGAGACSGVTCGDDEYCKNVPCSAATGARHGECTPRPTSCPAAAASRACGEDGQVYESQCLAAQAGYDVAAGCAAPTGTFACGAYFCEAATELCLFGWSDCDGGEPPRCVPIPAACAAEPVDCTCVEGAGLCEIGTPSCNDGSAGLNLVCL